MASESAAQMPAAMRSLRGRSWMRALRRISGLEKRLMARSHYFPAGEARVDLFEGFGGAFDGENRRAGHHQFANKRREFGVAAGKEKFSSGRFRRGGGKSPGFRNAGARLEPFEQFFAFVGDANADAALRGSFGGGLLHHRREFSRTEQMALLHNGDGGANFLEIGENVGADENCFALAI